MTKVSYKLTEYDGRYYFNDGTGYVLVDTGFNCHSRSLDGKIGPFSVSDQSPFTSPSPMGTLQFFLSSFLGPAKPEGQSPKAILYPLDMKTCLLKGDSSSIRLLITIRFSVSFSAFLLLNRGARGRNKAQFPL